jgi:hypothetical protein
MCCCKNCKWFKKALRYGKLWQSFEMHFSRGILVNALLVHQGGNNRAYATCTASLLRKLHNAFLSGRKKCGKVCSQFHRRLTGNHNVRVTSGYVLFTSHTCCSLSRPCARLFWESVLWRFNRSTQIKNAVFSSNTPAQSTRKFSFFRCIIHNLNWVHVCAWLCKKFACCRVLTISCNNFIPTFCSRGANMQIIIWSRRLKLNSMCPDNHITRGDCMIACF